MRTKKLKCLFLIKQEEVPPNVYYAHYKNVEKSMLNGRFDPTAGLTSSGIAGTAPEKDDDENKNANADEEMKDVSKKDGGKTNIFCSVFVAIEFCFSRSHAICSIRFNL